MFNFSFSFSFLIVILIVTTPVISAPLYFHKQIATQHIIPGYQQLAQSTKALQTQVALFCNTPLKKTLDTTRLQFKTAFLDWQSIQHIRFGPIQLFMRDFRFQLWPDKRGRVGKHLKKLLAEQDNMSLQADQFSHGSVAVQGFSALERLLYGDTIINSSNQLKQKKQCAVITAISKNLATMSTNIVKDWSEGKNAHLVSFNSPGEENDFYESRQELGSTLINNMYTQLELIVTQKLDRPLGKSIESARYKKAEAWRSQLSLAAIKRNILASQQMYHSGFEPIIKNTQLSESLSSRYLQIIKQIDSIDSPLFKAVSDNKSRMQLIKLRTLISQLKNTIARKLTIVLDIPLGFNSLDGD